MASSSWTGYAAPAQQHPSSSDRSKKVQNRQLLSCTKCRLRKVKACKPQDGGRDNNTDILKV